MSEPFRAAIADYLGRQRWFAGGAARIREVHPLPWLSPPEHEPRVRVELVTVAAEPADSVYCVPMSYYSAEHPPYEHALVGTCVDAEGNTWTAYDALHDRAAVRWLVDGFATEAAAGGLRYHVTGELRLPDDVSSLVLTGEQSNTSLVIGEDMLLKVFRKVQPGRNPDIEVHAALQHAGSHEVAPLRGWVATDSGPPGGYDIAMLQDFLRTATDGWTYARASVRDLLAEGDLYADEVGGDFAGEAERLGVTVARLHTDLARVLPTVRWGPEQLAALSLRLRRRLREAIAELPELAEHAGTLERAYADLGEIEHPVPAQRVHGDLHLGQALRAVDGWRIIDFEGEPAKPLAERTAPDSPVRDLAGMFRSFDYAAHSVALSDAADRQRQHRAAEWAQRNREAFFAGYAAEHGSAGFEQHALLRAYEIDKAVYEAVYEKHHRPSWLEIPLAAVQRLAVVAA